MDTSTDVWVGGKVIRSRFDTIRNKTVYQVEYVVPGNIAIYM